MMSDGLTNQSQSMLEYVEITIWPREGSLMAVNLEAIFTWSHGDAESPLCVCCASNGKPLFGIEPG